MAGNLEILPRCRAGRRENVSRKFFFRAASRPKFWGHRGAPCIKIKGEFRCIVLCNADCCAQSVKGSRAHGRPKSSENWKMRDLRTKSERKNSVSACASPFLLPRSSSRHQSACTVPSDVFTSLWKQSSSKEGVDFIVQDLCETLLQLARVKMKWDIFRARYIFTLN